MKTEHLKPLFLLILILLQLGRPLYAETAFIHRQDVQAFIQEMVKKHHFKKAPLIQLFSAVKMRPQVMKHIIKPLEKETWQTYQLLFISDWRIKNGVKFWQKYEAALSKAEAIYGVPASIIVATIGIETKYGERTGDFRVIDSLSNIAFSGSPRANFFRKELEEFLLLTREQHLNPLEVKGSYAGAIGQPQFMPSSYRYYAVNFSKSGKIDLMHNVVDIIGSIANYYQKHGWSSKDPIAVPASILGDRYHYLAKNNKITLPLTVAKLTRYGIVPKKRIKDESLKIRMIELENHFSREYWIGFHNFTVIRRYNPSDLYAMAVFQLSNHIKVLKDKSPSS